jgi:hypothetical protein
MRLFVFAFWGLFLVAETVESCTNKPNLFGQNAKKALFIQNSKKRHNF